MSKTEHVIYELNQLHTIACKDQWVNRLHPLVKFVLTIVYIAVVVSFHKYDVIGLVGMMVYPIAVFMLADLSIRDSLKRLKLVLPLVCFIGILNPIFDHNRIVIGGVEMSVGILSMLTLILKGAFCVFASYLLIATTTMEKLCYALRMVHIPKIMVNQLMLTYRYITLLLAEVSKVTQAYSLRAPKQKGIHIRAWGSLVGQLLLRSMDRANEVYESMLLRGFSGEYFYLDAKCKFRLNDFVYFLLWTGILIVFRMFPVVLIVGNFFRQ